MRGVTTLKHLSRDFSESETGLLVACLEEQTVQEIYSKDNRVVRGDKEVWKRGVHKKAGQEIMRLLIVRLDLERLEGESEADYEGRVWQRAQQPDCKFLPTKADESLVQYCKRFKELGMVRPF